DGPRPGADARVCGSVSVPAFFPLRQTLMARLATRLCPAPAATSGSILRIQMKHLTRLRSLAKISKRFHHGQPFRAAVMSGGTTVPDQRTGLPFRRMLPAL